MFEECISNLNSIFAVINPNYQFAINYSPTEQDLLNPYSIDVRTAKQLTSQNHGNILGKASVPRKDIFQEIDGLEIYDSTITLDEDVLDYSLKLYSVFNHEFGHILGIGDAYDNPYATFDTVMQAYSYDTPHDFTRNDVSVIDALYRDPANIKTEEEIEHFLENYATKNATEITDTINHKVFAVTSLQDLQTIKENKLSIINSLKNNFWGYNQTIINDLLQKMKIMDFNPEFGKTPVRFGEIPLETHDHSKTYHYCQYKVPFYIGGKTHTDYFTNSYSAEGAYTNLNFPIQTAASVCTDANGLIEDMSPYVYVNIDNYVLEIRLYERKTPEGVILEGKGVTLNAIYQITEKSCKEYFEDLFSKTATTTNETNLEK